MIHHLSTDSIGFNTIEPLKLTGMPLSKIAFITRSISYSTAGTPIAIAVTVLAV
jgi:hypothetical protein